MKRPRQRALVAALAAAPLLLTTGCGLTAATTTAYTKDVTDGVDAQVGDVDARNLLVVGRKGTEGVVSGALVNNGDQAVTVTVATQGAPQPVEVQLAPGVLVQLGSATGQTAVVTGTLSEASGALLPVQLTTPAGGTVAIQVPVLPPTLEYATITPPAN
ncbi:hypothetical protein [Angustibacter aerolatus]